MLTSNDSPITMKTIILSLSLALSTSLSALTLPSSVFHLEELEEAQALAAEKSKPICFVYTYEAIKPS